MRAQALGLAAAIGVAALSGCVRLPNYRMVAPRPPLNYETLGRAEGVGCGTSWLMLMPDRADTMDAGYGNRLGRALHSAIESVPGATGLINVEIRTNKTFYLIGSTTCVTVLGEAIR